MTPKRLILLLITALSVLLAPSLAQAGATPTPYLCPVGLSPACWCDSGSSVLSHSKAEVCLFVELTSPYPNPIFTTTGTPCLDANGEDLCAFQLEFSILSGALHTFTEAATVSAHRYATDSWRAQWLAPGTSAMPPIEARHVGTLELNDPDGTLSAAGVWVSGKSLAVKTNLTLSSIAHGSIAVPEPGFGSLLAAGLLLLARLARIRPRQAGAALAALACLGWGASPARAATLEYARPLVNDDVSFKEPSELGAVVTGVGDLNGDGVEDVALGSPSLYGGQGAVLLAFLRHDGTVNHTQMIADGKGGLPGGSLSLGAAFGTAIAIMPDMDGGGPGSVALAVSAPGEAPTGAVWLLFLAPDPTAPQPVAVVSQVMIPTAHPAYALAAVDDVNADGLPDLVLGLEEYADGVCPGTECGAIQVLHIGVGGGLTSFEPVIPEPSGMASGSLFGASMASLGDANGDGAGDVAVGSPGAASAKGVVWILFFNDGGGGALSQLIENSPDLLSSASSLLVPGDQFGASLAAPGDLDGNGTTDLVVGLPGRDGTTAGSTAAGSVAFLTLEADGTQTRPGVELNDAGGEIPTAFGLADSGTHTEFGRALAALDVDGDGDQEIFAGAATDLIETSAGIVWRLGLEDPDNDHLPDALGENCQGISNAGQADGDGDGVGDACDNCIDVPNGATTGICLEGDNLALRGYACTEHADCELAAPGTGFCAIDQADSDADGVGDACEQVVVTLDETATDDWSLELDCGAHNVSQLSVAIFAPEETLPLNLEFGGTAGVAGSGCESPGPSFFFGGGPAGNGCETGGNLITGIGATVELESGVFKSDASGNYTFPNGTSYADLRPNTLFAWLQGDPLLCHAGDTVPIADLEVAGGAAPADLAVAASNLGIFADGFLIGDEEALPAMTGCLISQLPPAPFAAKSATSFRSASILGPDLFADVSPLAPSGLGYQDWEVCFKSDHYMRKIKLAVGVPTGKFGEPPFSTAFDLTMVEWLGCPTTSSPPSANNCTNASHYPIETAGGVSYEIEPVGASQHYYVLEGNHPGHTYRLNSTLTQSPFINRYHCLGAVRVHNGTNVASHAPIVTLAGDSYLDSTLPDNETDPFGGALAYASSTLGVGGSASCTVPGDLDGDGVRTEADNCPYLANPDQLDQGVFDPSGILGVDGYSGAASYDGIGDACQCGEGNGNGFIVPADDDLMNLRKYLLGDDLPPGEFDLARCNVRNDPVNTEECNILDAVLLSRALENATTLPALCEAANLPVP